MHKQSKNWSGVQYPLKTNQWFLQCKLGRISTFWQPIDKPKDKFIGNYALRKNATYRAYLNQFSNKKGAIAKPESPKKHPIWAAHPRTHLSTKYPPGVESWGTEKSEMGVLCWFQTNLPLAALPLWWWYLYNCASATCRRGMTKRQAASSQLDR